MFSYKKFAATLYFFEIQAIIFKTIDKTIEIKIELVIGKKKLPFSPSTRMSPGNRPSGKPNFEARKIPPPMSKRRAPPIIR